MRALGYGLMSSHVHEVVLSDENGSLFGIPVEKCQKWHFDNPRRIDGEKCYRTQAEAVGGIINSAIDELEKRLEKLYELKTQVDA